MKQVLKIMKYLENNLNGFKSIFFNNLESDIININLEIDNINLLPYFEEQLNKIDFYLIDTLKFKNNNIELNISITNLDYNESEIKKPDYNNCILNIDSSIAKKYGKNINYPSNKDLDEILNKKDYKHIILMLLDGLGSDVLMDNLNPNAFLNKNKLTDISAVFPSTTAVATISTLSGKAPIETGWLGWQNYFKEVNKHVVLFRNTGYYTKDNLDINIERDILPFETFFNDFKNKTFELMPSFKENGCQTFNEMTERLINITKENDKTFTYAYWDNPDFVMHEYGSRHPKSKEVLETINYLLEQMLPKLASDTCLIITADHGHKDVLPIDLRKFKRLWDLLEIEPSNEARCQFFKVKENSKEEFKKLFNCYFSKYYDLYLKEEFLNNEFLGLNTVSIKHNRIDDFIGDFVAIAKSYYYFDCLNIEMLFKSHHAGLTKEEMTIPVIVYTK